MNKTKKVFFILLLLLLFLANSSVFADTKQINGSNWMSAVDENTLINEITLPGAHDAASFRLNGEAFTNLYGITQDSPIGSVSWKWAGKTYTDIGLLEMGARYFDIRYGLYDEPEKTSGFRNEQERVSSQLLTVHNSFDCVYRYDEGFLGVDLHKKVTNEVLMKWVKTFLDNNPSETVIFDISADEGNSSKDESVRELYSIFYKEQAEHPDLDHYPKIYIGDHIPTLKEARGKLVILTDKVDLRYEYAFEDEPEKKERWFFYSSYATANETDKTYTEAFRSNTSDARDYRNYSIFKQNKYDNFSWTDGSNEKLEYIQNTLFQTKDLIEKEKGENFNAIMLNYTSANNISDVDLFGNPWEFAEDINPKVLSFFKNATPLSGPYGYIAMDWMTPELSKAIYSVNINQNEYNITNVGLTVSSQNKYAVIIEIAFIVVLIIVVTVIVIKKRKNNKIKK